MGPPNRQRNAKRGGANANRRQRTRNLLAGGGGFEPPLRGPEPRVLPLDDPPPTPQPYHTHQRRTARRDTGEPSCGTPKTASLANRGLQGAARAEARHLGGRNLNLLAGARVAAVAGGAARDDECAEAGDRNAAAAAERLDDAADEGVHGALGGGLRASRGLRHDCYDLGLGHREPSLFY